MSNTKVPTLLKVTSILVIIGGALDIVVGLVGALLGAVVIYAGIETGTAALAWLGTLLIVLSLIYGVLKLVAGILGVQGKKLNVCLVLIAIIIAICVLDVVLALVQGGVHMVYRNFTDPARPVSAGRFGGTETECLSLPETGNRRNCVWMLR